MTYFNAIRYSDSPSLDAFARLRVSEPVTLFDSKQIFDNQPLFWDESLETGAGITSAHSVNEASTRMTSTNVTAGKFTRQTFMRFNYQPGKSQLVVMTGVLDDSGGGTGVQRRLGIFDDNNGIFFEDDEGTIKVVLRSKVTGSVVDTKVAQSSWNLDKMDGTGASGVTMDFSKSHVWIIDFEWLGVGRVRLGIYNAGSPIYVHQFLNDNTVNTSYMSTPNLPLRFQMITTSGSPVSTLVALCGSVISEGGVSELGILMCASTGGTHVDANVENIKYALVGIRLKSTHLGAQVKLIQASLAEHQGGKHLEWQVIMNPTIAGTPTWADLTNSSLQTFNGVTANAVTGGTVIGGGFFSSTNKGGSDAKSLDNALLLGSKIDGTPDELALIVRPIGGSINTNVEGSLVWRESP